MKLDKVKKIKKIQKTNLNLKVRAQGCDNDCEETIWAGRTAAEGYKAGCWSAPGNTPRTTTWW